MPSYFIRQETHDLKQYHLWLYTFELWLSCLSLEGWCQGLVSLRALTAHTSMWLHCSSSILAHLPFPYFLVYCHECCWTMCEDYLNFAKTWAPNNFLFET
jgi:hypothetical protein